MVNGSNKIRKLLTRRRVKQVTDRIRRIPIEARKLPGLLRYVADYTTDPRQNSVVPSMVLFYVLCIWDGWYNSFAAVIPTQVLEANLNEVQYMVFVHVTMVAPTMSLIGMCLRGKWAWTGAIMQLAGNIGVSGVLWTFIVAVVYSSWWGVGNFAGTWVLASALGASLFVIRDIRRLADSDRWEVHG